MPTINVFDAMNGMNASPLAGTTPAGNGGEGTDPWSNLAGTGTGAIVLDGSGGVYSTSAFNGLYAQANEPPVAAGLVRLTVTAAFSAVGAFGPMMLVSADGQSFYTALANAADNSIGVYKTTNGGSSFTAVGAPVTRALITGDILGFYCVRGAQIIYVNGTAIASRSDASIVPASISDALGGLFMQGVMAVGTGVHLGAFTVSSAFSSYDQMILDEDIAAFAAPLTDPAGTAAALDLYGSLATVVGSPTFGSTPLIPDGNGSMSVNANGHIEAAVDGPGSGDFSFEAWVSTTSNAAVCVMAGFLDGSLWVGTVTGKITISVDATETYSAAGTISDGLVHYVVAKRTGLLLQVFVDGVEVVNQTQAATRTNTASTIGVGDFNFGPSYPVGGVGWIGNISRFSYYATAISSSLIAGHGIAGKPYTIADTTIGGVAARILAPHSPNGQCIIYNHGVGETAASVATDVLKQPVIYEMAIAGYTICASTAAGDNWGNQAALDAYTALYTYMDANFALTRFSILSQSMGGLSGLLGIAAGAMPKVVAWVGIYPVANLANMFNSNVGTFAPDIRTAYGIASNGSDYSAKTSGHDPNLVAGSSFADLPFIFFASPADLTVNKTANSDLFSAHIVGEAISQEVVMCCGIHGDISHFRAVRVLSFLESLTPETPADFASPSHTDATIDLTWTPSGGATYYKIKDDGTVIKNVSDGSASSTTLAGLAQSTLFILTILAGNDHGESEESSPAVHVTTDDSGDDGGSGIRGRSFRDAALRGRNT